MIKDIIESNELVTPNTHALKVLKENFPACFRVDGSFDIERFKEYLSDKVTVTNDGYELRFLGKNYAKLLASMDTTTVIEPDIEHNSKVENKNSENIYISGDNLDALKHLLKSYANNIKCIYIDPPYNTGSDDFVYEDNFNFTVEELETKLNIDEERAKRILDLTKRGSASHSAWLMFIYPRLQLARDLLTDDGVIFISIDDNEQSNLKLLCDDIFGEENFVSNIIWQSTGGSNTGSSIVTVTEYILVFAKNKEKIKVKLLKKNDKNCKLKDKYFIERGHYYLQKLDGKFTPSHYSEALSYPIIYKGREIWPGGENYKSNELWNWRWSKDKTEWGIENGYIEFIENSNKIKIMFKNYEHVDNSGNPRVHSVPPKNIIGTDICTTANGTTELYGLFNNDYFPFPKSSKLIKYLLNLIDNNDGYILDFFSGSATTAHAVMQLNAEDGGNRKFIMVQIPEKCKETSEAYKVGYKNICEIGKERIRRAAKKIKEEYPKINTDLGFKHYTLKEPTETTIDKLEKFEPNKLLIDNTCLAEFGLPTVLTTWLVRDGYGFTADVQTIDFAGYNGYWKDKHLYLLDTDISNNAISAIIQKYLTDGAFNPENVVLFGYSFRYTDTEELKTNLSRLKDMEKNLSINFEIRY